jgi:hypothetical protein
MPSRKSRKSGRTKRSISRRSVDWKTLAPMKKKDRENLQEKCFLDENNRKYPICAKRVNSILCMGLSAARKRAILNEDDNIVFKADSLSKVMLCGSEGARERDKKSIKKSVLRASRGNRSRRVRSRRRRKSKKLRERVKTPLNKNHLADLKQVKKSKKKTSRKYDV